MIIEKGDCRNIAISHMLQKFGIKMSSVMCFGLGECYDFNYFIDKSSNVPMTIMLGRNNEGEKQLLNNLNFNIYEIGDNNKSILENMNEMDKVLQDNNSILINVDRYYLDYLDRKYNQYHCGWHSVIVENIYKDKMYTVYEPLLGEERVISYDRLAQARSSDCKPYSPNFGGLYVNKNGDNIISYQKVKEIIIRNVQNYLNKNNGGLYYLKKFKNDMSCLNDESLIKRNSVYIKLQLNFMSKYILEYENTKSFYRKVYAEFLREISQKYKLLYLDEIIKKFELLGDEWNKLGNIMQNYGEKLTNEYISEIQHEINIIIDFEFESMNLLLNKVISNY